MRLLRTAVLAAVALAAGCALLDQLDVPERNCATRTPSYPDTDGDGVGDPASAVYLGCTVPEGYVTVPPADDTDTDVF